MPVWGWVVLAVGVLVAIALIVWAAWRRQRTQRLQSRFGPEYERAVEEGDDRREAEADLIARERRRSELDIRPLEPEARQRHQSSWERVQADFVDRPAEAVREADRLVSEVMRERGYPVEDFDEQAAVVSVDHPRVVDNYRSAHEISMASDRNEASTEHLRKAMVHYRALFIDLLEEDRDAQEVS